MTDHQDRSQGLPRYPRPVHPLVQRSGPAQAAHGLLRLLCAAVPIALGALALWQQSQVRVLEAVVARAWLNPVLDGPVGQVSDIVYFAWVGGPVIGMQVSEQCTVAYLLGPMCLLAALLVAITKSSLLRLGAALLVGASLLVIVNQLRLAIIALGTQHWGLTGYDVTHKLMGTAFALVGFTLAALVMVVVATGHRPRKTDREVLS